MTNKGIIDKQLQIIKSFLEEHPETMSDIFSECNFQDINENVKRLTEIVFPDSPSGKYKLDIIRKIIKNSEICETLEVQSIKIYDDEVKILNSICEEKDATLYYCLLVYSKLHPHSSGWIHFDMENVCRIYYNENQISKIRLEDFSSLIQYGLDFRVIGSQTALPCYMIMQSKCENIAYEISLRHANYKQIFKEIWKND